MANEEHNVKSTLHFQT